MNTKNKLSLALVIGAAALTVFLSNASATTLVLDYGSRHFGNGGEFNVYSSTLNPVTLGYAAVARYNSHSRGTGFETFCLETHEDFIPGGTYKYQISQAAFHGGVPNGSNPISLGTAFLYQQFAHGTLTNYNYVTLGGSSASANELQQAIWWLEGQGPIQNLSNQYENMVIAMFHSVNGAMADNAGHYNVAVLNITYLDGRLAQDQLVLVPVPDGGTTVMLLGLGLLGLFAGGRKLRAAKL